MSTTVSISPLTRIEGHLGIHTETEPVSTDSHGPHKVTKARCEGEMFRGLEKILEGRDPLDAQQITQRICGVCPISHGIASVRAQESAYGIRPTHNGLLQQNLIQAANYLQSHILHFYHLAALDFVDVTAVLKYTGNDAGLRAVRAWVEQGLARSDPFAAAPFLPRVEGDYLKNQDGNVALLAHYLQALEMRRICHEMAAVFGAKLPHSTSLIPGGCTQHVDIERILAYRARLEQIETFVREVYVPDVKAVAREFPAYAECGASYGNFLAFGVFDLAEPGKKWLSGGAIVEGKWEPLDTQQIVEDVTFARFSAESGGAPTLSRTIAAPAKPGSYSWIKAPRYRAKPMEVGPLARLMVNYLDPQASWVRTEADAFLKSLNLPVAKLNSVLGRHAARALEASWLARQADAWIDELRPGEPSTAAFEIPERATGVGLTEAPRGALGHWLEIKDYVIHRYQCIVPTTWNCSPRDQQGQPGPIERALEGALVANPAQPIELGRIVRSFDPCLACAVH